MPVKRDGGGEGGGAEAGAEIRFVFGFLNKSLVESEERREGEDSRSHATTVLLSFLVLVLMVCSLPLCLLNNWWE
jgi:hypothetical protein